MKKYFNFDGLHFYAPYLPILFICCVISLFPTPAICDQKQNLEITQLAWSPDQQKVALIEGGRQMIVMSRKSGKPLWQVPIDGIFMKTHDKYDATHILFWSPRGDRLALAYISQYGNVTIKVFKNGKPTGSSSTPAISSNQLEGSYIPHASWSPDGKHIGIGFWRAYNQPGPIWIFSTNGNRIINRYAKARSFYWLGKGIAFYVDQGIKVVPDVESNNKSQSSSLPLKLSKKAGWFAAYATKSKDLYILQQKISDEEYEIERLSCYRMYGRSQRLSWFREFKVQRRDWGGDNKIVIGDNSWIAAYLIYATDGSSSGMTWCVSKNRTIDLRNKVRNSDNCYNIIPLQWRGGKLLYQANFLNDDRNYDRDEIYEFDLSTLKHRFIKNETWKPEVSFWASPSYRLKASFSSIAGQLRMRTTALY